MSTSLPVLSPPKVHTDLLCSCALRLVRERRSISSTACSRWKVAVPAHTRYTAPEPLSTGQWERPNRWAHSPEGIWIWREGTCEKWLHKLSCTEKYLLVGTSTHVSPTLKPNSFTSDFLLLSFPGAAQPPPTYPMCLAPDSFHHCPWQQEAAGCWGPHVEEDVEQAATGRLCESGPPSRAAAGHLRAEQVRGSKGEICWGQAYMNTFVRWTHEAEFLNIPLPSLLSFRNSQTVWFQAI